MSEANDHKFGPLVGLPIALNGVTFVVVEPGTIIRSPDGAQEVVVDDTHIAFSAGACYVTQAIADAIKVACDGAT